MKELFSLLTSHSTPGDEDEVAKILLNSWSNAGLTCQTHGRYAISAKSTNFDPNKKTMLVTAHMDSPGFSVESIIQDSNEIKIIPLGAPKFSTDEATAILKYNNKKIEIIIRQESLTIPWNEEINHGDRICFEAEPEINEDGIIKSPFLDNRLGCWILCRLATIISKNHNMNIILGATSCEEMGGFGAPVLANALKPDLVICLDATYEDENQAVIIGEGPVLTLSDNSVIVGCKLRNQVQKLFADFNIPLQTEVYNFSGTDAKAFPHQGLPAPVLALLIPTQGNHSPLEIGSLTDVESLYSAIPHIANNAQKYGFLTGFSN